MDKQELKELRQKLRSRISEQKITRSGRKQKKKVLKDTLASLGVDSEEFMKNLEIMNKAQKQGLV